MAIEARWAPEDGAWRLEAGERLSLADIAEVFEQTEFGDAKRFIWDLRAMTSGPDATGDLHRAVKLLGESLDPSRGARSAILVSRDFDFGIARMFQVFAERIGLRRQLSAG